VNNIPAAHADDTYDERVADLMSYGLTRAQAETRAESELVARGDAYHAHPSHWSDCQAYEADHGHRCPCERATS